MPGSRAKRLAFLVLVIVVAIQFYRPARTNPPVEQAQVVTAAAKVPAEVAAILKRSCYDCHSSETKWPWYSTVSPMSWLVISDVNHGRSHFNLSEWGTYPAKKRSDILDNMCDEVRTGEMPLKRYLLLHRDAQLAEGDWKLICDWAGEEADRLR